MDVQESSIRGQSASVFASPNEHAPSCGVSHQAASASTSDVAGRWISLDNDLKILSHRMEYTQFVGEQSFYINVTA